jgi:predicted transport protein
MSKTKWHADKVVLFASIEKSQHDALRYIAYKEARSIADIVREALNDYLECKSPEYPIRDLGPKTVESLKVEA